MAFDPTLPATGALVTSQVLRDQFNGLKELIDAVPVGVSQAQVDATVAAAFSDENNGTARDPQSVGPLSMTVSDPPTQAEVQAVADRLDQLIQALYRHP